MSRSEARQRWTTGCGRCRGFDGDEEEQVGGGSQGRRCDDGGVGTMARSRPRRWPAPKGRARTAGRLVLSRVKETSTRSCHTRPDVLSCSTIVESERRTAGGAYGRSSSWLLIATLGSAGGKYQGPVLSPPTGRVDPSSRQSWVVGSGSSSMTDRLVCQSQLVPWIKSRYRVSSRTTLPASPTWQRPFSRAPVPQAPLAPLLRLIRGALSRS
jgi:hypothetical protein